MTRRNGTVISNLSQNWPQKNSNDENATSKKIAESTALPAVFDSPTAPNPMSPLGEGRVYEEVERLPRQESYTRREGERGRRDRRGQDRPGDDRPDDRPPSETHLSKIPEAERESDEQDAARSGQPEQRDGVRTAGKRNSPPMRDRVVGEHHASEEPEDGRPPEERAVLTRHGHPAFG